MGWLRGDFYFDPLRLSDDLLHVVNEFITK